MTVQGLIIKAISGAFYVQTDDAILPCKARGIFRKRGIAPLAGDYVRIEDDNIIEILPRKNELVRPKAANIDLALMTVSTTEPSPNTFVLDKMLAVCEYKKIEPVIILTKTDLKEDDSFAEIYRKAGYTVILTGEDIHNEQDIHRKPELRTPPHCLQIPAESHPAVRQRRLQIHPRYRSSSAEAPPESPDHRNGHCTPALWAPFL